MTVKTPYTKETPQTSTEPASDQPRFRKVFVVLNPVAGLTDADSTKEQIVQFCEDRGLEYDIHETQKDEDVSQLVRDTLERGVDLVIAAGGDGTVSGVVAGMINSKVPMGILPGGTGNALARELSIPLDLSDALGLFESDYTVRTLDVMQVNKEKYYVMNVSVGVSSVIMRTTLRKEKRRFGMFAYIYRAVGSLVNASLHRFTVHVDGRPVQFAASELMIANSKLIMGLQPQIDGVEVNPNDGRLDMFIVRAQSLRDYLNVASGFLLRRDRNDDATMNYLEARETISIESEFPLPVQADGEVIGNTPVEIRMLPNALRTIVPTAEE